MPKQEVCLPCMDNADCLGGMKIAVAPGFWRDTKTREVMWQCFKGSFCEGGYEPGNQYPVKCKEGYYGILCNACRYEKDTEMRYYKSGSSCAKCPNAVINVVRILGFTVLILIVVFLVIWFNVRKKKESEISIIVKIITNYIQTLTVSVSFDV